LTFFLDRVTYALETKVQRQQSAIDALQQQLMEKSQMLFMFQQQQQQQQQQQGQAATAPASAQVLLHLSILRFRQRMKK
jgi:hypothetical protein